MSKRPTAKAPPPDSPKGEVGERVQLRANHLRNGTCVYASPLKWMTIKWDDGHPAPKICHPYEMKLLPIDETEKTVVRVEPQ